jgi:uncharacterized caspase-like protein
LIGNSAYANVPALVNPTRDARALAEKFKEVGFDVVSLEQNVGNLEFKRAIRQFENEAAYADIAVVYYAGHGMEINGDNLLIPVDAKLASDRDAVDETVPLERVVSAIEGRKSLGLIIIDASRDNPFLGTMTRSKTSGQNSGLGRVAPSSENVLIAYSAKAGSVAEDGSGEHSPFTTALLNSLFVPGLDVRLAFGRVRDQVLRATASRQEPFVYGSLGGGVLALVPAAEKLNTDQQTDDVVAGDYDLVSRVGSKRAWEIFLTQHPKGFYADLARARLAGLAEESNGDPGREKTTNTNTATRDVQSERAGPPDTLFWWWPRWR